MKICISPLNIYLNSRIVAFRQQLKILKTERVIERAYKYLKIKFRNCRKRRRRVKITLNLLKD